MADVTVEESSGTTMVLAAAGGGPRAARRATTPRATGRNGPTPRKGGEDAVRLCAWGMGVAPAAANVAPSVPRGHPPRGSAVLHCGFTVPPLPRDDGRCSG